MTEATIRRIASFDGTELAVHIVGEGRPVVLLHGLFSNADMNWIRFGHAGRLADAGFQAIMPDLRAHGQSAAPHDPAAYSDNVLVEDLRAVIAALGLESFDLVGFSLGARTVAAGVVAGIRPRKLVLSGMGLESFDNWEKRAAFFIDAIDRFSEIKRGDRAYFAVQFMKTMHIDREAARLLLAASHQVARSDLPRITVPTLVLAGKDDHDNGSPEALADVLPDAELQLIPGNHMSCVTMPELGKELVRFLSA